MPERFSLDRMASSLPDRRPGPAGPIARESCGGPFGGRSGGTISSAVRRPTMLIVTGVIFRLNRTARRPPTSVRYCHHGSAQPTRNAGWRDAHLAQMTNVLANIPRFTPTAGGWLRVGLDPHYWTALGIGERRRAFDEMNQITRGSNGGWIQIMGPSSLLKDFKRNREYLYTDTGQRR